MISSYPAEKGTANSHHSFQTFLRRSSFWVKVSINCSLHTGEKQQQEIRRADNLYRDTGYVFIILKIDQGYGNSKQWRLLGEISRDAARGWVMIKLNTI